MQINLLYADADGCAVKAYVCSPLTAWNADSNLAEACMFVCCVYCVLYTQRPLRRADRPFSAVLPSM